MNFLESSAVMVPALTGMALTLYDGNPDVLSEFEYKYCFSSQLQKIYTTQGMTAFLQEGTEDYVYDLEEAMGTRFTAFKINGQWVMLGPYVETKWSEHGARLLLAKMNASEAVLPMYKAYRCKLPIVRQELAVKTAFVMAENLGSKRRSVETLYLDSEGRGPIFDFSERYTNTEEVICRYGLEDRFIEAISRGDGGEAHRVWRQIGKVSSDLRFISDSIQDQLAGAAVIRTLIRIGAKLGGLSPVLIDSVSQEYAQRMKHSRSKAEMESFISEMMGRICDEVWAGRQSGWSPVVQRAVEYIELNLSRPVTTEEIALAAGEKKRSFVSRFLKETGMTIKEYLAKKRCAIAVQLLAGSEASVQEIAVYVGYLDNNYFSKVFKANIGMSPQAFRKLHNTIPMKEKIKK